MIVFHVGRCQWLIRFFPWYLASTISEEDGDTYYRICRQWHFGRWWLRRTPLNRRTPAIITGFSFGPIELRRFAQPINELRKAADTKP